VSRRLQAKIITVTFYLTDLMRLERVVPETQRDLNADHPMTWDSYHSYEDILAYIKYLETTYKDLVRRNYQLSYN